ncbi:hypothetical protein CTAM01_14736 [Colletotrichum tamarilloi]|nr:uncharacterized protein CTAM01_14736 [Colletotrichum tamarilloi]KAK1479258.1 hypothetical protein CTAM01_14736 [Colletotrichum tamarilloi]
MIGCNRPVEDVSGGRLRRGVGVVAEDIPDLDIDVSRSGDPLCRYMMTAWRIKVLSRDPKGGDRSKS